MLHLHNITLSYGDRILFNDVDWVIPEKRRAALIGPNGAGKTTLLKIVAGELQPDVGSIVKPSDYVIGYLPQEEINVGASSILAGAMQGKPELLRIELEIERLRKAISLSTDVDARLLQKLGDLEHEYEIADGYKLEGRAKAVLAGLGFKHEDFYRSIAEFSGGWRMRVYLARLLLQNPDLLLLDEPTNHLDLPSLEWLEQYLAAFDGSIIIVSHDRFFIDRLADEIFELDNGVLTRYAGNYHFYEQKKEADKALLLKKAEQAEKERKKQQEFIDRFRYKNTKARQVQSRVKMLDKMEQAQAPAASQKALSFQLRASSQSYKNVLNVTNMSFKYDRDWVLQDINLSLYRGEKAALVGENGAGKTTLTRLIVGQLQAQKGHIQIGERVSIGYYAQHQVDALDLDSDVYSEIEKTVADSQIPNIRNVLGLFGLHGDDAFKPIRVLSGGEKARVSLSKILLSPVNFLIMDEPTNHLDIRSKEALEKALMDYDGTLIIISHDRYFLDRIVNKVIEVKDKKIKQFEGNYSDYLIKRQTAINDSPAGETTKNAVKRKDEKRRKAEARQSVSKKRRELTLLIRECEEKIHHFESRKQELEKLLADPASYKNGEAAAELTREYQQVKDDIDQHYKTWEQKQLDLEALLDKLQQ